MRVIERDATGRGGVTVALGVLAACLIVAPSPGGGAEPRALRLAGFTVGERPGGAGDQAPATEAPPGPAPAEQEEPQPQGEGAVDSLIREFMSTSESIEGRRGDQPVAMDRTQGGQPALYSVLAATKADNPLLTRQCRRQAAEFSVAKLQRSLGLAGEGEGAVIGAAAEHIQRHVETIAGMGGQVDFSQYLRMIAECREFCAPLVAHLVRCHTLSVARHDHGIVLFEYDRYDLDPRYVRPSGLLARVAEALRADPERRVLLVGRASKIGDLRYNRRLSGQRALAVRDALMEQGIAGDWIQTTWFGWEPPQITAAMAREYGLQHLYGRFGPAKLNQSVVVVLYSPSPDREARPRPRRLAPTSGPAG